MMCSSGAVRSVLGVVIDYGEHQTEVEAGRFVLLPRISRGSGSFMNASDMHAHELIQPAPSMRFTLRQVECFIAVAEQGSISAAAEALRSSDSSIADAISAMER